MRPTNSTSTPTSLTSLDTRGTSASALVLCFLFAAATVTAACAKEKNGNAPKTDPGPAGAAVKAAPPAEGEMIKPPTVAMGANRTEMLSDAKEIAKTEQYTVSLKAPSSAAAGKASAAQVILTPAKGWKLNQEFPYSLKVTAPAGVTLAKDNQGKADAKEWDKVAVWDIGFTSEAGSKSFAGEFSFAVCTDATCNPYREKLAFSVDVK